MKMKKRWLVFWSAILVAVITTTGVILGNSNDGKVQKNKQVNEKGDNLAAGNDINQPGRDNIKAERDVYITNPPPDSPKEKNEPKVEITSYQQSGGITAQNVIVINQAIAISSEKKEEVVAKKENYYCAIDTSKKQILVQPKKGSWQNTFIGIPENEKLAVSPHFGNQSRDIKFKTPSTYLLDGDNVYAIESTGQPASDALYYSLKYKKLPSYIIFGNAPDLLYKADLSKYQN